jgi:hypothetical protein
MRLINTTTFQLHEFFDDQIPLYAILSHRWEGAEVTFQDLNDEKGVEMKGDPRYAKLLGCCAQAKEDGFEFAVCRSSLIHSVLRPILFGICCSLLCFGVYCRNSDEVLTFHRSSWQWIDSCCIDKTSSAELSEAINSMFRWYQNAQVCYAYLSDVPERYPLDHYGHESEF